MDENNNLNQNANSENENKTEQATVETVASENAETNQEYENKRAAIDEALFFGKDFSKDDMFIDKKNPNVANDVEKAKVRNYSKKNGKRAVSLLLAVILCFVFFAGGILTGNLINEDAWVAHYMANLMNKHAYFATETITTEDILLYGMDGVLTDPYFAFRTPEATQEMVSANKGVSKSFGMTVAELVGFEGIYITNVVAGSGAEKAGVQVGYRLLAVNGQDVSLYKIDELTPIILAIPDNTDAAFTFATVDDEGYSDMTNQITLHFARTSFIEQVAIYYDNKSEGLIGLLDNDTAYVKLTSFVGATAEQFAEVMSTFKKNNKKNLILDLRDNTGGTATNLAAVGSYLLSDGTGNRPLILTEEYKDGSKSDLYADACYYDDYGFDKIIVLTNGYTASASEALLDAMIDYKTVDLIIGSTTFGKGTGLSTYIMPITNYSITFTSSYFFSPSGRTHEAVGISPSSGYLMTSLSPVPYYFAGDDILMRAVNYLK